VLPCFFLKGEVMYPTRWKSIAYKIAPIINEMRKRGINSFDNYDVYLVALKNNFCDEVHEMKQKTAGRNIAKHLESMNVFAYYSKFHGWVTY